LLWDLLRKQEVLGRTNRLLSLIRHRPHWKRRVQQFFYCCVCIRYRGNFSTKPLHNNDRGIFSLLSLFWKNKVGLWDHVAARVCVFVSPLLTFERLNQSSWNLVRVSRHLSRSQRPN
jgi:hypothetical protein